MPVWLVSCVAFTTMTATRSFRRSPTLTMSKTRFGFSAAHPSGSEPGGCWTRTARKQGIVIGVTFRRAENRYSDSELTEIIVRLVEAGRPRAAFDVVQLDWSRVETSRLKHLLWAIATRSSETEVYYDLDAYYISKALDSLGGRDGIAEDEMAQLEFTHINCAPGQRTRYSLSRTAD